VVLGSAEGLFRLGERMGFAGLPRGVRRGSGLGAASALMARDKERKEATASDVQLVFFI
jgi:hypothetical protein